MILRWCLCWWWWWSWWMQADIISSVCYLHPWTSPGSDCCSLSTAISVICVAWPGLAIIIPRLPQDSRWSEISRTTLCEPRNKTWSLMFDIWLQISLYRLRCYDMAFYWEHPLLVLLDFLAGLQQFLLKVMMKNTSFSFTASVNCFSLLGSCFDAWMW